MLDSWLFFRFYTDLYVIVSRPRLIHAALGLYPLRLLKKNSETSFLVSL